MSRTRMWYRESSLTVVSRFREARIFCKIITTGAIALMVNGCSGANYRPDQVNAATVKTDLPAPSITDMVRDQADYRIGPLDKLSVAVFGVADLNTSGQVDAAGNFSMPLVGSVTAMGESPGSLARKLEVALGARYIRNPQVTVTVTEAVSQIVTVEGTVTRPGAYPVVGRSTLVRVIAIAGGTTDYSRLSEVVVFRTVGGERMVARFNLKDIRGARAPDPEIFGNDVVVVGYNTGRRIFQDILSVTPLAGVFYQITK